MCGVREDGFPLCGEANLPTVYLAEVLDAECGDRGGNLRSEVVRGRETPTQPETITPLTFKRLLVLTTGRKLRATNRALECDVELNRAAILD